MTEQSPGSPTGSSESLATVALKAKDAAEAIADAEVTRAVAEDVSNKLNALDIKIFITNRFRRQAGSTTATTLPMGNGKFPSPVNCDNLKTRLTDLTSVMDSSTPDFSRANNLVETLTSLDPSSLSPGCYSSDWAELDRAKNAAKAVAEAMVTTQINFISAKTNELNALVSLISALNQEISSALGSTVDSGTSATSIPTVDTEGVFQLH